MVVVRVAVGVVLWMIAAMDRSHGMVIVVTVWVEVRRGIVE
jgi:hypothetical protein